MYIRDRRRMVMEYWESKLRGLISRRKNNITFDSSDGMNRRLGDQLGGEDEYRGFRSVIFYFQLSTKLDLKLIEKMVLKIFSMTKSSFHNIKLATLFFSDSDYNLIHPKGIVHSGRQVMTIMREYYPKYAAENESYSNILKHLFPPIDIYSREQYPSNKDLCIVFHDDRKIDFDDKVLTRINALKHNFIWIQAVEGTDTSFSEDIT
jgi:hypothetical protein